MGAIGQTDGRQDRRLNKFLCVQQDFIPFGAAAPKITDNANILVIYDCFEPLGNPRWAPLGVPSLNLCTPPPDTPDSRILT